MEKYLIRENSYADGQQCRASREYLDSAFKTEFTQMNLGKCTFFSQEIFNYIHIKGYLRQ